VERLCREFHYGKTKISQAYKRVTGKGVHEYITELRIEQAKRLLQNGELSIIQISEQVGFSSPQYFSKTFLSKVGCSPSGFRAKAFREQA
jgi:AraC-like DNA-binding protein